MGGALAVAALGAILFGFHLGSYGLWEPDEARYAEIAREMLARANFLLPHLNYVPYVEKPPLLYWLTALSFRIFGLSELAARLTPALAAIIGLLATYLFASIIFDRRRGLVAGVVLATTPLYAVMAQVLTTDMLLTAMITVAFFALFLHWREGGRWCWLAYVAIAMAVLTKGPVGAVLPALAMLVFLWWEGDLGGALGRFHVLAGLALIFVIAAPWFIYMTMAMPGYFDFYFIGEHLRRFLEAGYSHSEPIYFYIPVIAAGMLPWSVLACVLDWRAVRFDAAHRFCLIAALVVFGFFSLARAKLIPYVMPMFPPLAVLIGDAMSRTIESRPSRLVVAAPMLGIIGAVAAVVAIFAPDFSTPYMVPARPALNAIAIVGLSGGILASAALWTGRVRGKFEFGVLAIGGALMLMAGSYGRLAVEPLRSYAKLSATVAAAAPDARLICYRRYVQALPFYARRRVILVGAKTELTFGATHAPDADRWFFEGRRALLRLWRAPGPAVVLLDKSDLGRLQSSLGRFTVIGSEWKKIAISKPADDAAGY
jgi:4-amino-4-deoxy-L-arabinose transferase-like glycosyltransferase